MFLQQSAEMRDICCMHGGDDAAAAAVCVGTIHAVLLNIMHESMMVERNRASLFWSVVGRSNRVPAGLRRSIDPPAGAVHHGRGRDIIG